MRLFIAIDTNSKKYFENIQTQIKQIQELQCNYSKQFHITLAFLGNKTEQECSYIKDKLKTIKFEKFNLATKPTLGYFPSQEFIRIIWTRLQESKELKTLQHKVVSLIDKYYSQKEPFVPHITVGRVKNSNQSKLVWHKLNNIIYPLKKFQINSIKLYKSQITTNGPEYKELLTIKSQD